MPRGHQQKAKTTQCEGKLNYPHQMVRKTVDGVSNGPPVHSISLPEKGQRAEKTTGTGVLERTLRHGEYARDRSLLVLQSPP